MATKADAKADKKASAKKSTAKPAAKKSAGKPAAKSAAKPAAKANKVVSAFGMNPGDALNDLRMSDKAKPLYEHVKRFIKPRPSSR